MCVDAPKAAPVKSMYSSDASQLRIAIDMNYDHLMTDKVTKGEAITCIIILWCVL